MGGNAKTRYRFVGTHADTLANGQPVEPGEFVELSEEDEDDNKRFIDEDQLISVEAASDPAATEAATKMAKKEGIPLNAVSGTGANGEITVGDVEQYIEEQKVVNNT